MKYCARWTRATLGTGEWCQQLSLHASHLFSNPSNLTNYSYFSITFNVTNDSSSSIKGYIDFKDLSKCTSVKGSLKNTSAFYI